MTRPILFLILLLLAPWRPALALPEPQQLAKIESMLDAWDTREAEKLIHDLEREDADAWRYYKARLEFLRGRYDLAAEALRDIETERPAMREFKTLLAQTRKATAKFSERATDHFIIRFADGPDQILAHYAKEALERSYETLGKLFDYYPIEKVLVEIYPAREPFSQISPLTMKDIVTSGTVALCKYNRIMLISPGSMVRGYNWLDTLSHEYIHYLLTKKSLNTVPLWLHEGLAKYYEAQWRGQPEPLTPIMETILAKSLEANYFIGLSEMMPSFAKLKNAEDVHLAYAEVASMTGYMLSMKGEGVIADMLAALAGGASVDEAMQNLFGQKLPAFQLNWQEYARQQKYKTIPGVKTVSFSFKKNRGQSDDEADREHSPIESQAAREWLLLGDILRAREHLQAAIIEYRKAVKDAGYQTPLIHNKLALALMQQKEYNKAEPLLREILDIYPLFHTTLTNLGELYYLTGQHEKALKFFQSAVRINPFNPLVHTRLIEIFGLLKMPREKELQRKLFTYLE